MSEGQWFVRRDGLILGPYTRDELEGLARRGKVVGDDIVSPDGHGLWRQFRTMPWFPGESAPPPAPVRAPPPTTSRPGSPMVAGTVVDGRYRLATRLGEGTYGVVWRAADLRLSQRAVAVKFLKREYLSNIEVLARFQAEADALARVQHANVVALLDRGLWQGHHFLVTEYVADSTLRGWIESFRNAGTRPPVQQALALVDRICAGVDAGHQIREPGPIVHRDLKPDNIILRESPGGDLEVKIVDFGIAQLGQRQGTRTGALLGTPRYMAPEQALGHAAGVTPAADVFAIAVIAIEALTVRASPSEEATWWGLALQQPGAIPGCLRDLRSDVPASLWDVLAAALSPKPAERPSTAGALRAALRGTPATPQPEVGRTVPPGVAPMAPTIAVGGSSGTLPMDSLAPASLPSTDGSTNAPLPVSVPGSAGHRSFPLSTTASPKDAARNPRLVATVAGGIALGVLLLLAVFTSRSTTPGAARRRAAGTGLAATPTLPCPAGMVFVPGGTFTMGSTAVDAEPNELPAHRVSVDPFCIDRTEVTVLAYRACVDNGVCTPASATVRFSNKPWPDNIVRGDRAYYRSPPRPLRDIWNPHCTYVREGFEQHPVTCLDWRQARTYCAWAGRRLPREAEWEFAARGRSNATYPWGRSLPDGTRTNFADVNYRRVLRVDLPRLPPPQDLVEVADDAFGATAPVGSYPGGASDLGVLDLAGNVWEWTQDRYAAYSDDPSDPAPVDPTTRVARGGGFASYLVHATRRAAISEEDRVSYLGFRCAAAPFANANTDAGPSRERSQP